MIQKLWIMFYFWNNCNITFPVFDAYNVNFQELQLDFIFRIMPQKQIFGHGAIVFLSHPYQMANPKSILEMWLAGLGMAKILAIRRKWTLNGMNHSRIKTERSWNSWRPPRFYSYNHWGSMIELKSKIPLPVTNLVRGPSIFGLVHFGLGNKSINYQRIFSEIIRCYQPR